MSKINELSTTDSDQVTIQTTDEFGVIGQTTVQSMKYLSNEIDRLNNNINSLYSIDDSGATIATASNRFRKVVVVDINKEPSRINNLGFKHEVENQLRIQELHENLKKAEQQGLQDLAPELQDSVDELKAAAESVQEPYQNK